MSELLGALPRLRWLVLRAGSTVLLLVAGLAAGWHTARLSSAIPVVELGPPRIQSLTQVGRPDGPVILSMAEPMPESNSSSGGQAFVAADTRHGIAAEDELLDLMAAVKEPEIPATESSNRRKILDPRDASVVPPPWVAAAPAGSVEGGSESVVLPGRAGPVHVVMPGETLSNIAANYGVEPEMVSAANEIDDARLVFPGQRLTIPGGVPPTPAATAVSSASSSRAPSGPTPGAAQSSSRATATATPTASARPASSATPTPQRTATPRPAPVAIPVGPMVWPAAGGLTQRFGEKSHSGIDIAANTGAPVKAAAPGTVLTAAKISYGYGWRIIIDHGAGYTSLYAHLSALNVSEGVKVVRGQVIGAVGNTGFSTGPHLHFEVLVNGKVTDPLKYLP